MKLLVIRLSAFGDVAMTVPVIDSLARQYPQLDITVLSRPFMAPLFSLMPANVHFRGIDLTQNDGPSGLLALFRQLRGEGFNLVADLHDVLRSKVLRTLFFLSGVKTAHIDKGRRGKKALVRQHGKELVEQPTSFSRYVAVFARLGYPVEPAFHSIYGQGKGDASLFASVAVPACGERWIGVAPFAAHRGKILPQATVEELLRRLTADNRHRVFLFGGGGQERAAMEQWAAAYPRVVSLSGKLKLDGELALISHLNVMVSMDSANMHLASLVGVPVVSVWGATHPFAGFMGWGQSMDNTVQLDLPCRPCSIFGNKPCLRGDYACLEGLKAEMIMNKINLILGV